MEPQTAILWLCLLAVVLRASISACARAAPGTIRISLTRVKSQRMQIIEDRLAGRADRNPDGSWVKPLAEVGLKNQQDMEYVGLLTAGTPPQDFTIDFDTGSSDLWIWGMNCTSAPCMQNDRYDSSKSSSYVPNGKPFTINYGDGSNVQGVVSQDDVTIGGVKAPRQQFAEITAEQGFDNQPPPFDGICGLAHQSISQIGSPTPVQTMVNDGTLARNIFSFLLLDQPEGGTGSVLVLGAPDDSLHTGPIRYTPITQQSYYVIKLQNVTGGNGQAIGCGSQCGAIVDSGTSLIVAPTAAYKEIVKLTDAKNNKEIGAPTVSCNKLSSMPNIVFTISGAKFPLTPTQYTVKLGNNVCILGFQNGGQDVAGPGNGWILGDVYMRAYYTVFDVDGNRVGFATPAQPSQSESASASEEFSFSNFLAGIVKLINTLKAFFI